MKKYQNVSRHCEDCKRYTLHLVKTVDFNREDKCTCCQRVTSQVLTGFHLPLEAREHLARMAAFSMFGRGM